MAAASVAWPVVISSSVPSVHRGHGLEILLLKVLTLDSWVGISFLISRKLEEIREHRPIKVSTL